MRQRLHSFKAIFQHDAAGGILLLVAALLALVVKNTALGPLYDDLLALPLGIRIGGLGLEKALLLWINDGLMAVFFFLVGLEIKREFVEGDLSSFGRAALPGIAAAGGMAVPALIYSVVNWGDPVALRGWAIPAATDIAFAVGILALLGSRVPPSLRIFLLALAILDDLGAIVIIALFYTADLHPTALLLAVAGIAALVALNRGGVTRFAPYLWVGLFIWVCVLKSGVHATLAGVVVALAIPLTRAGDEPSLLEHLEEGLDGWVTFCVLPLFAFANAGVAFAGMTLGKLVSGVPLGIVLGLLLGKPIGILAATWAAIASGIAPKPSGATWAHLLGAGMLGGIGFTMSLFIGMLAFTDAEHAAELRLGVLTGSLLSALAGYTLLRVTSRPSPPRPPG